jgi:hypothetical protein
MHSATISRLASRHDRRTVASSMRCRPSGDSPTASPAARAATSVVLRRAGGRLREPDRGLAALRRRAGRRRQRAVGVLGNGASSLQLLAGSSATSPVFCVDLNYPTFRFLAVQQQHAADAGLQVDVIYPEIAKGNVHMAATYKPLKAWTLMKDVKLEPQRAGKQAGWRRVAPCASGCPRRRRAPSWNVDNILVDPRCRN